jgi:hypothetical protein
MRGYLNRLVRGVGAPVLFGAVTVSLGTVAYVLFCPGISSAVRGQAEPLPSFLLTAAVVGALLGAAVGLCIAADRAARDFPQAPAAGAARRPRRMAGPACRLRRPPVRYGRERRRVPARVS